MTKSDRFEELRERRASMLRLEANRRLREEHGADLAALISSAIGKQLSVDDFGCLPEGSPELIWPRKISEAPGLVAAYIDQASAARILGCFGERIGLFSGYIGFHDKAYLGFSRVSELNPVALLRIAQLAEDSVVFVMGNMKGVVLVDFYSTPAFNPLSVVVQGVDLVKALNNCFEERVKTESGQSS